MWKDKLSKDPIPFGWAVHENHPYHRNTYGTYDPATGKVSILGEKYQCFSTLGGVNGGRIAVLAIPEELKKRWGEEVPDIRIWYNEVNKNFFPLEVIEYQYKPWAEYEPWAVYEAVGGYKENVSKAILLDLPVRYAGIYTAYMKLRSLLPKVKPWYLLQVAHFLPACGAMISKGEKRATPDKVAYALTFMGGNHNHTLGRQNGVPVKNPLNKETPEKCFSKVGTCQGFWDKGPAAWEPPPSHGYIPLEWTWEEFAAWTEQFIKEETKRGQKKEAPAHCG